ncbi:MAG: hypothetical protein M1829_001557 [Trizodia sp. TS-e1964]|nr:MAG: hypothetical protein M1829_001557 [Trizodia sp. TS-e1964]
MDLASSLIRSIVRVFYETKHILVIDALMIHSVLRDDEMAYLLGMQTKELHKLCGKLKEDRLLAVHNRSEIKEGSQRPINRLYYFIDFQASIDAIKWRVYRLTKEVSGSVLPVDEKKEYFCPRCKSQWTQMEVLDSFGSEGFLCHKCGHLLDRVTEGTGDMSNHEKQRRLMDQINPLLKMLEQIDDCVVPFNDFDSAYRTALPVKRDENINPATHTTPLPSSTLGQPTSVKGLAASHQTLKVSLTTTSEKSEAEQAAEAQRKSQLAAQNALPDWHLQSTVSGDAAASVGKDFAERKGQRSPSLAASQIFSNGEEKKPIIGADLNANKKDEDEIAAYYALLARDQEQEEQDEQESDGSTDNEDEDDNAFEDVGGINGAPGNTINGAASKAASSNESSPAGMAPSVPKSTKRPSPDDDERSVKSSPTKKTRLSPKDDTKELFTNTASATISDEDEEGLEFEDV